MNLNGIQKDWNELDVAIVSGKAASMINSVRTIDTGLGDHRAKIYGLNLAKRYKKSWTKIEETTRKQKIKPIAVARMRGKSEEATEKRGKVVEKIQEKIRRCNDSDLCDGGVTAHDKVVRMMEILRESAEEVVGREFNQKLALFMDGHLDEMKEKTEEINALFMAVLTAKTKSEKDRARKARNSATAAWKKTKRTWKAAWIKKITTEVETAMQRHDLGTFCRGLKQLGIAYSEISLAGRVDHTPDQLRAHYSKLGSTPNVVRDEILDAITIKRPTDLTLAEQPTEDEVKREVARMKDSAPGADEVTSMLKIAVGTEEGLVALSDTIRTVWNTCSYSCGPSSCIKLSSSLCEKERRAF